LEDLFSSRKTESAASIKNLFSFLFKKFNFGSVVTFKPYLGEKYFDFVSMFSPTFEVITDLPVSIYLLLLYCKG
jgi:hypothetical protein